MTAVGLGFESAREPCRRPELLEQTGRVVALSPGLAVIQTSRRGACGGCAHGGACAAPILGALAGGRSADRGIQVADHLGLRLGEAVVLGVPAGTLIRAAALAYLLPPSVMVIGATGAAAVGLGDLGSGAVGVLGLAVALALTRCLGAGAAARGCDRPMLIRRQQA